MRSENLADVVNSLTPQQQAAVREFIDFLTTQPTDNRFGAAVAEFVAEHPELLRRLAQ